MIRRPRKYLSRNSRRRRRMKTVEQEGGLNLLIIPALTALAPVAGSLLSDLYGFIKKKVSGSGVNLNKLKSEQDKKQFVLQLLNKL